MKAARTHFLHLLLALTWAAASPALPAEGGGLALVKARAGEAEQFWKAIPFTSAKPFPDVLKIFPAGAKDSLSVPNAQVGEVLPLPDLKLGNFTTAAEFALVTAARIKLEALANRCKAAAPTLQTYLKAFTQAEEKFASGSVLRAGKWSTVEEWKREMTRPPRLTIPTLTIGENTYVNVTLTDFLPPNVSVLHQAGVCIIKLTELSDAQIAQLNGTSKTVKIDRAAK